VVLRNQQTAFTETIAKLSAAQREQTRQFGELLATEEQLFDREEQVSEFLNGRLLPSAEVTPPNACTESLASHLLPVGADPVTIIYGKNAAAVTTFPHTILGVDDKSLLSVDRLASGSLALFLEIQDTFNRVIVRLDKNGFIVNNNYSFYLLRPDKSTVTIDNQFGEQVLNARFLNPRTFVVSGTIEYGNSKISIDSPFRKDNIVEGNCSAVFGPIRGPDVPDIQIYTRPPGQPVGR
jgi:hypothetical protein